MSKTLTVSWGGIFDGYASQRVKVSGDDEELVIPFNAPHESMYLACKCKNNELNGVGHIYCNGECLADLTFENNKLHGPYKIYYNGKVTSCGTLQLGKREGETTEYCDGVVTFKGSYVNNRREGEGKEFDIHGFPIYAGKYKRGVRVTTDYFVSHNAVTYKCHLLDSTLLRGQYDPYTSQFHGYCVEVDFNNNPIQLSYYQNGDSVCQLRLYNSSNMMEFNQNHSVVYVGSYANNPGLWYPREGFGFELCHSVPVYSGNFHNDARDGEGCAYYINGSLLYEGMWKNGQISGNGVCYCEDGSIFGKGEWEENSRQEADGTYADLNRAIKEDRDLKDIMLNSISFCLRGEKLQTMADVYKLDMIKRVKSRKCHEVEPILEDSLGGGSNPISSVEVGIEVLYSFLNEENFCQDSSVINTIAQENQNDGTQSMSSVDPGTSNRLSTKNSLRETPAAEASNNENERVSLVLSSIENIPKPGDSSLVSISTIRGLLFSKGAKPLYQSTIPEVPEKDEQVVVRVPTKKSVVVDGSRSSVILRSTKQIPTEEGTPMSDETPKTDETPKSNETPKSDETPKSKQSVSSSSPKLGISRVAATLSTSAFSKIPEIRATASLQFSRMDQFPSIDGASLYDSTAESQSEPNQPPNAAQSQVVNEPPPPPPPPMVNEPPPIQPIYSTHFSAEIQPPKVETENSIHSSTVNKPPTVETENSIHSSTVNKPPTVETENSIPPPPAPLRQTSTEAIPLYIPSLHQNRDSTPAFPFVSTIKLPKETDDKPVPLTPPYPTPSNEPSQGLPPSSAVATAASSAIPQNKPMNSMQPNQSENLPLTQSSSQLQKSSQLTNSLSNSSLRRSAASSKKGVKGQKVDTERNLIYTGTFVDGKLHDKGEVRTLSSNSLLEEGTFRNGSLISGSIYNPDTSAIISKGTYKDGKLHGYGTLYYANGQKYCEGVFLNEKPHGKVVFYWESGKMMFNGKIINDQPCDLCKYYDENGILTKEVVYENGKERSIATYAMGRCTCKAPMQNGKREGHGQEWDLAGHLVFDGEYHDNLQYSGVYYSYSMRGVELLARILTLKDGNPDPTVKIFATPNLEAMAIDDSWRCVYIGGWTCANNNINLLQRAGRGALYLPDGRILEGQWYGDRIPPESFVTVYAPAVPERFPQRKEAWFCGNVWLDDSMSLLQPTLRYHGRGKFFFQDKSYFEGQWNGGLLESYSCIFWENGKVKYRGQIKQYDLNDPNCIHEYLPTGLVLYYPLNQNYIVEGQFDDHYNCINNPITLYTLDGALIRQQNADYSMEPDNYNVRYVNF